MVFVLCVIGIVVCCLLMVCLVGWGWVVGGIGYWVCFWCFIGFVWVWCCSWVGWCWFSFCKWLWWGFWLWSFWLRCCGWWLVWLCCLVIVGWFWLKLICVVCVVGILDWFWVIVLCLKFCCFGVIFYVEC